MSLEVYIQDNPGPPSLSKKSQHICTLDDDGYYWFLHPLYMRLAEESGEYVDLYGGATFQGDLLEALEQVLFSAQKMVASQSDDWEVVTGYNTDNPSSEVYSTVNKQRIMALLNQLISASRAARDRNGCLTFWGD